MIYFRMLYRLMKKDYQARTSKFPTFIMNLTFSLKARTFQFLYLLTSLNNPFFHLKDVTSAFKSKQLI